MRIATIALVAVLAGCGVTASRDEPHQTDFIMISRGEASIIYKILGGGVDYCKVTKHGIPHKDFEANMQYDGKKCEVIIEGGDKE